MEESKAGLSGVIAGRMPFCGRTLAEYQKMFDLNLPALRGKKVLDCPAGASSFAAEASKSGIQAVACDPQFGRDVKELVEKGKIDLEEVIETIRQEPRLYNWAFYPSIPALKEYRLAAMERFVRDYPAGIVEKRYVEGTLPTLPFLDRRFELVLSSYFLFSEGEPFDFDFHLAGLLELYRVCSGEVRVYPIYLNRSLDREFHHPLDRLRDEIDRRDIQWRIVPVPFEFHRGSNHMLRLIR
jgi:hypothetical protein